MSSYLFYSTRIECSEHSSFKSQVSGFVGPDLNRNSHMTFDVKMNRVRFMLLL